MSDWGRCPLCNESGFLNSSSIWLRHVCKPRWECRAAWQDEDDWRDVHAEDSERAAERYAERYDQNDGCYPIVSGDMHCDDVIILVRKDEDAPVERFCIEAEMVPSYRASKAYDSEETSALQGKTE